MAIEAVAFVIEKGIPVSRPIRGPGAASPETHPLPFKQMSVGDSFVLPKEMWTHSRKGLPFSWKQRGDRVRTYADAYTRSADGKNKAFIVRVVDEDGERRLRCWRTK